MHLNCAMKFFENLQLAGQSFLSIFLDPHDRQQGVLHLGEDVDPRVLPQKYVVLKTIWDLDIVIDLSISLPMTLIFPRK